MAKLSRRNKKRVSKAKKKATQKMKTMIKNVVLKNSETKHRDDYSYVASYLNGSMRSTNLTYAVPQGDNNFSRDGDIIDITGYAIKAYVQSAINIEQLYVHFALIEHDLELSGQQANVGAVGNYIRNFNSDSALWSLDLARCKKVFWCKTVKLRSNYGGTGEKSLIFTKYTRLRRRFKYNVASGFGTGANLYLITWVTHSGGLTDTMGIKLDTRLYFKDI